MSVKKIKEVDSIYSGGSTKRSRILDDISCSSNVTSARWSSILSCCWKSRVKREEKPAILKEFNPNEWDYIVEKLVVKRVPLSLFGTEEDFQEFIEEKNYKEIVPTAVGKEIRDKQVYHAMPEMGSSLFFLKTKARGDLSDKPSGKNLRFNRDEDLLDEDAVQAGPSNYNRGVFNPRINEADEANEVLNQFSSLHPDLKDNERPPKDPNPLNPPLSKRSLAENISEIGATNKISSAKYKKDKERHKRGSNVFITVSDTSREISTVNIGTEEEEIPTRDKSVAKHNSISRKMSGKACLPYPKKIPKIRGTEITEGRQIRPEVNPPYNQRELPENINDRDFSTKSQNTKASQFKVDHVTSDNYSINKVPAELIRHYELTDAGLKSPRKNDPELRKSAAARTKPVTEATSYTSDDLKNENSAAGTTLRWKIIIKHHQPTASQNTNDTESLNKIEMEDKMGYKNG